MISYCTQNKKIVYKPDVFYIACEGTVNITSRQLAVFSPILFSCGIATKIKIMALDGKVYTLNVNVVGDAHTYIFDFKMTLEIDDPTHVTKYQVGDVDQDPSTGVSMDYVRHVCITYDPSAKSSNKISNFDKDTYTVTVDYSNNIPIIKNVDEGTITIGEDVYIDNLDVSIIYTGSVEGDTGVSFPTMSYIDTQNKSLPYVCLSNLTLPESLTVPACSLRDCIVSSCDIASDVFYIICNGTIIINSGEARALYLFDIGNKTIKFVP